MYKKAFENTELELERKLPQSQAYSNPGHGRSGTSDHNNSSTTARLNNRISTYGSFSNGGTKPTMNRESFSTQSNIDHQRKNLSTKVTQQFESRYN